MIRADKPLGPRELVRLADLSSPSVAHWHLQKLESAGLICKNSYGEYIVKEKVGISGYFWVGKILVPRLIFYAFFFAGILLMEIGVMFVTVFQFNQLPNVYLIYLMATTLIAMGLFLSEGMWLRNKTKVDPKKKKISRSI
jgi:hypothetical protein